jgi:signal transduction histidine kinase
MSNQQRLEEDVTYCPNMEPGKFMAHIFSGIRHEIGNPINSIKMTISVLKENIDLYPKEKVIEYIDRVLMETNRMEYLLKSLKSFNMFEDLTYRQVQLSVFMEKFFTRIEEELKQKKISVHCHINPELKYINTDPMALQHVLLNILTNAVDALTDIENPEISICISRTPGEIYFKITDNGPGIVEEHKEEICKPFFSTKRHKTGLGLCIVQDILLRMKGGLRFQSKKNIGTTVIIRIPGDQHVNP